MGWPKGKPRKPKPAPAEPVKQEQPWEKEVAERDRILRSDRAEPASRKDGAMRMEADSVRADVLPDDDLERFLESEALTQSLPNPPKQAGWHHFWGSTTNQQTPIQMYLRLGYVFVKPEEIPEWTHMKAHSASYGCDVIQCNEMLLMKTTEERYQRIMKHLHHDKPMSEAERLLANFELMKSEIGRDSKGKMLVTEEGDAFSDMVDRRIRSTSFE